jgi:hypothetical protein
VVKQAAEIPICRSCATWSSIKAINGEMTTAVVALRTAGNW